MQKEENDIGKFFFWGGGFFVLEKSFVNSDTLVFLSQMLNTKN